MKAYNPPKVIMHEQVEFGTVNISNNFFYRWCKQFNFRPFICRLFFGSGSVGGGHGFNEPFSGIKGTPK